MYAIIEDGGKQYKVTTGDTIRLDRYVKPAAGGQGREGQTQTQEQQEQPKTITFDRVLLVGGEGQPKVGAPLVGGATVTADVLGPVKGKKIDIFKYRRRKGYRRRAGHRQKYLAVKITGINV